MATLGGCNAYKISRRKKKKKEEGGEMGEARSRAHAADSAEKGLGLHLLGPVSQPFILFTVPLHVVANVHKLILIATRLEPA